MICVQCLDPLPQPGRKNRQFCSARCRRDAFGDRNGYQCVDCGKPCRVNQKNSGSAQERCQGCNMVKLLADRERKADAYHESLSRLWVDGKSIRDIAAMLDTTPNAIGTRISQLRAVGDERFPYRHNGFGVAA